MKDKDYVSKEVAYLLKDMDYDGHCDAYYNDIFKNIPVHVGARNGGYVSKYTINVEKGGLLAPTLYEIQQWLIDKFKIFVHVDYDYEYYYELIDLNGKYSDEGENYILCGGEEMSDTYQEALNKGIKMALEKYIKL